MPPTCWWYGDRLSVSVEGSGHTQLTVSCRFTQVIDYWTLFYLCVSVRGRCGWTCGPHRPIHHHPPQEHQRNHGEKRGCHGVRCQCKVHTLIHTQRCKGSHKWKCAQTDLHTVPENPAQYVIFCDLNDCWNLLFEHDGKAFCASFILYLSSIPAFDSRLHSVLAALCNPSCEFDYYLQFKGLIRMTDMFHCSLNAV